MQNIRILLDVMPAEEISPLKIRDALRGIGFCFNGIPHQRVSDERDLTPFYQFRGSIEKNAESISVEFKNIYKKEIEKKLQGLAENIRLTFNYD